MVADQIEEWVQNSPADGFNLMSRWLPDDLDGFVDHVVAVFQWRGLFRAAYTDDTLRGHLDGTGGHPEPCAGPLMVPLSRAVYSGGK
jgi:hypothetical protein